MERPDKPRLMPLSSQPSQKPSETPSRENLEGATTAMGRGLDEMRLAVRLSTMWPRMGRLCPPRSTRLWFIGGRPGNYKTQLMWNLAMDLATLRQRVLFISLEQTTGEMAVQALARFSRVSLDMLEQGQNPNTPLSIEEQAGFTIASRKLAETEMFLRLHGADRHGHTLDDVIASATRNRFDAIFIDHIGMIGRGGGNELAQLSDAIDAVRRLARGLVKRDYRPFVCCTSPLNRQAEGDGDEDRLPQLRDFRGSGRIESDADVALILKKRPKAKQAEASAPEPDVVDAFVLKNRQGRCPLVLQFEAQGSICFVNERKPDTAEPPRHYSETGES